MPHQYKWKGREQDYHKEYMRSYRKRQKHILKQQKDKLEFYEKTYGSVEWEIV